MDPKFQERVARERASVRRSKRNSGMAASATSSRSSVSSSSKMMRDSTTTLPGAVAVLGNDYDYNDDEEEEEEVGNGNRNGNGNAEDAVDPLTVQARERRARERAKERRSTRISMTSAQANSRPSLPGAVAVVGISGMADLDEEDEEVPQVPSTVNSNSNSNMNHTMEELDHVQLRERRARERVKQRRSTAKEGAIGLPDLGEDHVLGPEDDDDDEDSSAAAPPTMPPSNTLEKSDPTPSTNQNLHASSKSDTSFPPGDAGTEQPEMPPSLPPPNARNTLSVAHPGATSIPEPVFDAALNNAQRANAGELAVAIEIHEEDEWRINEEDKSIIVAQMYDPKAKPPLWRNRRVQCFGCFGVFLILFVILIAALVASNSYQNNFGRHKKHDLLPPPPLPPTTTAPSMTPMASQRDSLLRSIFITEINDATNNHFRTAIHVAALSCGELGV